MSVHDGETARLESKIDFKVVAEFTRRALKLVCDAPEATGPLAVLELVIGRRRFAAPLPPGVATTLSIPLAELEPLPDLAHRLRVAWPDREQVLRPVPILTLIDIRTEAEFLDRIQSPKDRISDPEVVRFCSRRMLATSGSPLNLRASAICALGYRIAEFGDPADDDIARFWPWLEAYLTDFGGDQDVRWTTSVTMAGLYVAMLQTDYPKTVHYLERTLSYRQYLPKLSLLHTNFSRSSILLALINLARGERAAASALLSDIGEIFRVGARSSWIDHPHRGRWQYSEIYAVLKPVQMAAAIRNQIREARDDRALIQLALTTPIAPISALTRQLEEQGRWRDVLLAAAGANWSGDTPPLSPRKAPQPARLPPGAAPANPEALAGALTSALAKGVDPASAFKTGVASYSAAALKAAAVGDVAFRHQFSGPLDLLMRLDASLRGERNFIWPGLLELAKIRFLTAILALAAGDRDDALQMLKASTQWGKWVLSTALIENDADFEPAGAFVLAILLSYIAAYRYLEQQPALLADNSIPSDFTSTFDYVFRDAPLKARALALLQADSAAKG